MLFRSEALSRWVARELGPHVPVHFTAFHPDWKMTDKPRTLHQTLIRSRHIALEQGLHHVYVGNVQDKHRQSTYCHDCGERLIGRDSYVLSEWKLDPAGRCLRCGAQCPGVFDGPPGQWGARRQPVRIAPVA